MANAILSVDIIMNTQKILYNYGIDPINKQAEYVLANIKKNGFMNSAKGIFSIK